jgi:hypothetical protein
MIPSSFIVHGMAVVRDCTCVSQYFKTRIKLDEPDFDLGDPTYDGQIPDCFLSVLQH